MKPNKTVMIEQKNTALEHLILQTTAFKMCEMKTIMKYSVGGDGFCSVPTYSDGC